MRKICGLVGTLILLATASPSYASEAFGTWLVENGKAVVEIKQCGSDVCGQLIWLRDDANQYDYKNPNFSDRNKPLCNIRLLWGFKDLGNGRYEDGQIYKADDGDIYNANMNLVEQNKLHLRGYVGIPILGKSQYWTRVNPADYKRCKGAVGAFDPAKAGGQAAPSQSGGYN
jgi:uncharacterized protein (DUF2147 family)